MAGLPDAVSKRYRDVQGAFQRRAWVKPANQRVATFVEQFGIEFEIRLLPDAVRTAKLAAQELGRDVGQIANSLNFRGPGGDWQDPAQH